MDLSIDLNIFEVEPADEYHGKADRYLSSHQLLDFIKCPWLHRKKRLGLIDDTDSPAYLVGRAAHTRVLEGRDVYESTFALGGPVNPKTGRPFGANTKAFADWAEAQGKARHGTTRRARQNGILNTGDTHDTDEHADYDHHTIAAEADRLWRTRHRQDHLRRFGGCDPAGL